MDLITYSSHTNGVETGQTQMVSMHGLLTHDHERTHTITDAPCATASVRWREWTGLSFRVTAVYSLQREGGVSKKVNENRWTPKAE